MFVNPHFTFNGIYSKDMNICISTMNNDMFNDIGIEYSSDIEIETNSVEHNPYFIENPSEVSEIELNLLLYNSNTMEGLSIDDYNIEELYDWLITENFSPFISDDDTNLIYYFKVTKLQKVLTFDKMGYLRVTFKPYTKYVYKKEIKDLYIMSNVTTELYNPSKLTYKPIIEVTNLGNKTTINKINNMEITNLEKNEKVIIDNLTKIVQSSDGINKFNCCNAKWIELQPKVNNILTLEGNCRIEIICEFPLIQ